MRKVTVSTGKGVAPGECTVGPPENTGKIFASTAKAESNTLADQALSPMTQALWIAPKALGTRVAPSLLYVRELVTLSSSCLHWLCSSRDGARALCTVKVVFNQPKMF